MAVVFCSYGMQNVVLNETIVIVKSFFMDLQCSFFPYKAFVDTPPKIHLHLDVSYILSYNGAVIKCT